MSDNTPVEAYVIETHQIEGMRLYWSKACHGWITDISQATTFESSVKAFDFATAPWGLQLESSTFITVPYIH